MAKVLTDCIKKAHGRRQVFIVTHNPNLAVVCDAGSASRNHDISTVRFAPTPNPGDSDMRQHRWRNWIESREVEQFLLEEAKAWLKTAWESDREGGYPLSTSDALAEIRNVVSPRRPPRPRVTRLPKPKQQKTLADLIPERLVQGFQDSLKQRIERAQQLLK